MSRWGPITVDDLNDAKLAPLVEALQTKALAEDQDDPTPRITQSVVDRIRRKIASCKTNRLDADETAIPRGLKTMATAFILGELKNRLEIDLTDDERGAIRSYETDLNRIADCKDTIDEPDDPIDPEVEDTSGTPDVTIDRLQQKRRAHGL